MFFAGLNSSTVYWLVGGAVLALILMAIFLPKLFRLIVGGIWMVVVVGYWGIVAVCFWIVSLISLMFTALPYLCIAGAVYYVITAENKMVAIGMLLGTVIFAGVTLTTEEIKNRVHKIFAESGIRILAHFSQQGTEENPWYRVAWMSASYSAYQKIVEQANAVGLWVSRDRHFEARGAEHYQDNKGEGVQFIAAVFKQDDRTK